MEERDGKFQKKLRLAGSSMMRKEANTQEGWDQCLNFG